MKIKTDFVTNSSTTSFVVIGATINKEDIPISYIEEAAKKEGLPVEYLQKSLYDLADTLVSTSDLSFTTGPSYEDDELMIGINYTKMHEDETLSQFRNRVKLQILELFGIIVEPYHIEEAWRDG